MALTYLYPQGIEADNAAWTANSGAKDAAVDDPFNQPDDDTTYIECNSSAADQEIVFRLTNMVELVSVASVQLIMRSRNPGSNSAVQTPFLWINGVRYDGTPQTLGAGSSYATYTDTFSTNPETSLPWSRTDLNALCAGLEQANNATELSRCTQLYVKVDFVPSAVQIGAARDVGSRMLRLFRRAVPTADVTGPLLWADVELLGDFAFSHLAYPYPVANQGAGHKRWQRALLRTVSHSIDLDRLTVSLSALDLRQYLVRFWDTAIAEQAASATAGGAARLDPGVGRTFTRASKAYVLNAATEPQGFRQIIEAGADIEKAEPLGLLMEEERTNDILNSAFTDGIASSWTSSAVTNDTTDLLFESSITPQSALMTRVGTGNCRMSQVISYAGSEELTLGVWHQDDSGGALGWSAQRSTDSFYWNQATPGWQMASVVNTFTVRSEPTLDQSTVPIVLSASAQDVTWRIHAESASGQIAHVYHVQVEEGRFATSAIVTGGSASTRIADHLVIENPTDEDAVWWDEQGTAGVTWVPLMSTDSSLDDCTLFAVFLGGESSEWERVLYNHADGEFRYERRLSGNTFAATLPMSITRGQSYRVVARHAGEEEELGLAPYTLSIFVNGTKGTDDVASGPPPAGAELRIGCQGNVVATHLANGNLSHISTIPFVLHDEEVGDWL